MLRDARAATTWQPTWHSWTIHAGSAQVRRAGASLHHGSIVPDGSQARAGGGTAETSLTVVFGRPATFEEVATALVANWGERLTPSDSPTVPRSGVVASLAPR